MRHTGDIQRDLIGIVSEAVNVLEINAVKLSWIVMDRVAPVAFVLLLLVIRKRRGENSSIEVVVVLDVVDGGSVGRVSEEMVICCELVW